jgi:hypothetical protein
MDGMKKGVDQFVLDAAVGAGSVVVVGPRIILERLPASLITCCL